MRLMNGNTVSRCLSGMPKCFELAKNGWYLHLFISAESTKDFRSEEDQEVVSTSGGRRPDQQRLSVCRIDGSSEHQHGFLRRQQRYANQSGTFPLRMIIILLTTSILSCCRLHIEAAFKEKARAVAEADSQKEMLPNFANPMIIRPVDTPLH